MCVRHPTLPSGVGLIGRCREDLGADDREEVGEAEGGLGGPVDRVVCEREVAVVPAHRTGFASGLRAARASCQMDNFPIALSANESAPLLLPPGLGR